jgi:RraA family protein
LGLNRFKPEKSPQFPLLKTDGFKMNLKATSTSDAALMNAFRGKPTAVISDNMDRLPGPVGLFRYNNGAPLVGRALTVRTCAGDNLAIHQALEIVQPGDVVVVDGGGDTSRALVGEIMKAIAEKRGAVGFIIDGAVRDGGAFAQSDFACYAKAIIHRGPYKNGPGEINVPVSIGGCVINPGDIIVGDEDGVVSFSAAVAPQLLIAVEAQMKREENTLKSIANGTYTGSYGAKAKS